MLTPDWKEGGAVTPSDAVRKWTHAFQKRRSFALYLCYKPCWGFAHTHATLYIFLHFFQTLDSPRPPCPKKKCADKDVLLKNRWTILSHDNTHHTEYSKHAGAVLGEQRKRVILWKQAEEEEEGRGVEYLGWHTEVQRLMWRMERKEKKKITHTHTHKHKSTAVTSCWVRSRKQKHKDGIKTTQRCRDAECPRSPCDDLWFDLTVKCPSWWSGKWMKRYSVATSCMIESPRNSILWLWPLDEKEEGRKKGMHKEQQGWGELFTTVQIFTLFF